MNKEGETGWRTREKQDGLGGKNRMNKEEKTGWIRMVKHDG